MRHLTGTAVIAAAVLALTGCTIDIDSAGPVEHMQKSIDLDKSAQAKVEIKMGAGELRVDGGSAKLMDADFEYTSALAKPEVRFVSGDAESALTIEQPSGIHGSSKSSYKWEVRLNDKKPLEVVTHLGAGQAHLNLGTLNLRGVEVHMGVGQVDVDLRGNPSKDYNVEVHGGIGQATIHVPSTVGIIANASGGIGHIEAHGLESRNGRWINAGHENAPVTIHLDIKGGIGNITLTAE